MLYRRSCVSGGTFFFTLALEDRHATTLVTHVGSLRAAVATVMARHRLTIDAFVVLPDHLHAVWTLPPGDADYSVRWSLIKAGLSRSVPRVEWVASSRSRKGERGIWQRRFWEHQIRDDDDFERHVNYVHFNPVKHGYVVRASEWPYSSIHRAIRHGVLAGDWGGDGGQAGEFGEP